MWDESARAAFADLLPPGHPFPELDPERWYELLDDPAVSMLVVEDGGEPVGVSACGESRDDDAGPGVGEVRSFFVAAGRWRQGVGRELLAAALDSLRERGCAEATVWSFAANERANAFYESAGFTRDGAEKTEDAWAGLLQVRYRRIL
ncbi:MAG TPA: GNAT family N-acetyltransferase [Thermoleophilaceae bacterium]|nr:GNAT family N-acetyltransferase [Thermoleophilaceae bacterium]